MFQGMARNEGVKRADRLTRLRQFLPDPGGMIRGSRGERENRERCYEFRDDTQVALDRRRVKCPVKQFMIADGRQENGGGTVLREMGEHLGSPLNEMNAGVGIEQERQNLTSRCSP